MVWKTFAQFHVKCSFLYIIFYLWQLSVCQTLTASKQELFNRSVSDVQHIWPTFSIYNHHRLAGVHFKVINSTLPHKFYARIHISGTPYTLKLRRNKKLINGDFVIENYNLPGTHSMSKNHCHYIGRVLEVRRSKAAISVCKGLRGFFEIDGEVYFIEPLTMSMDSYTHVLYKSRNVLNSSNVKSHRRIKGSDIGYTCQAQNVIEDSQSETGKSTLKKEKRNVNENKKSEKREKRRNKVEMMAVDVRVFVVVDKEMVAFHGNASLMEYVLTMMNMVADLYKDRSLGAFVNIVVSKILVLHKDQDDLTISHHGDETLRSFCHWQYSRVWYSGQAKKKILKYDVAILLTRKDVCVNRNSPCGTIGMAYIGGLCNPRRKCSVIEDIGLNTAFTIAHELGHSFGMVHDGEDNSCNMNSNQVPHMMASRWPDENQVGALKWSSCSRDVLVDFLSSYRSLCLQRPQTKARYSEEKSFMAGTIYDADQQCKQQYGSLAKHCKHFKTTSRPTDLCKQLWCELEGEEECISKLDPVAKGTPCAPGKWCMFGNCISNDTIPDKVDGGWSRWSNWTECSQKCGVGVSLMSRKCNNPPPINGGRHCEGVSKKYRTCNYQPCPENHEDPRIEQCRKFNNVTFSWVPVTSNRNPCGLYCRPEQDTVHLSVQFAPKVIDGTPCRSGSKDICIDGKCQRIGCDFQLNSKLERDICGVCGGNGTTCNLVEGEFTQPSGEGYVTAVVIPKGAQNVMVKEEKPCASFLALKSGVGSYHINGNWKIELPGEFNINGTIIYYEREGTQEMFYTEGPTKAPLHIMVLFQDFNLGVKYRYVMQHRDKKQKAENVLVNDGKDSYGWMQGPWGLCSVVCGGGLKKRKGSKCIRMAGSNVTVVNEKLCLGAKKPKPDERTCNEQKCILTWAVSTWTACSRTCGIGKQRRDTRCVGQKKNGQWEIRRSKNCPKDKPITVRKCVLRACFLSWRVEHWSRCKAACGRRGIMYRRVDCPIKGACSPYNKPPRMRVCQTKKCKYHWIASNWSKCSTTCGNGVQNRKVICIEELSGKQKKGFCHPKNRPKSRRICSHTRCPTLQPHNKVTTTSATTLVGTVVTLTKRSSSIVKLSKGTEYFTEKDTTAISQTAKKNTTLDKNKSEKEEKDCKTNLLKTIACKLLATETFCKNPVNRMRCCLSCKDRKSG